eukprot:9314684-Karenia_brevis.AAC.1
MMFHPYIICNIRFVSAPSHAGARIRVAARAAGMIRAVAAAHPEAAAGRGHLTVNQQPVGQYMFAWAWLLLV